MITALQVLIILSILAILGMIVGYLLGKISCKREESGSYIEKSSFCEEKAKDITKKQNDLLEKEAKDINEHLEQASTPVSLLKNNEEDITTHEIKEKPKESTSKDESEKLNNKETIQTNNEEKTPTEQSSNLSPQDNNDTTDKLEGSKLDNEDNGVSLKEQLNSLETPNNNNADNLCEIKGIGKVIESKLNALGIYHFYQIAAWGEKEIALVDEHLAFKGRINRENWIEQAKLLAEGKETEFAKRVKEGEVPSSSKE